MFITVSRSLQWSSITCRTISGQKRLATCTRRARTSSSISPMENAGHGSRWTPMSNRAGKPLPFALSKQAAMDRFRYVMREPPRPYQNKALHAWIAHWIYADVTPSSLFTTPFYWGILVLALQLPFSIRKDIQRRKELRYGRRLKGPILVSPRQFT